MFNLAPRRVALLLWPLVMLGCTMAHPSVAAAAPMVTEYSGSLISDTPMDVAQGPDGNVWFTENGGGAVGRITPAGTISDFATPTDNSQPRGITAGPDGNLWFTESAKDKIGRVTPSGVVTEFPVAGLNTPIGITAGADGNLWFTESGDAGAIWRITPAGVLTKYTNGLTPNSAPWYITSGPDGNIWFTENVNAGRIGKLNPVTGAIVEYSGVPSGLPWGITGGPDGNVWFTVGGGASAIGKITPSGAITEYTAGLTRGFPVGITSARDGNLYFTEKTGSGAVGSITPSGVITEYTSGLTPNSAPQGITSGADGNIWFAEAISPGRLGRLTTAPGASTGSATVVDSSSATLSATISPHTQATTYAFQYGLSTQYGSTTPSVNAGASAGNVPETYTVTGLTPGTAYHFRVAATNGSGTTYGTDRTFSTPPQSSGNPTPPAPTTSSGTPTTPAPVLIAGSAPLDPQAQPTSDPRVARPTLGRTVSVAAITGTLLIKLPGTTQFEPLASAATVPVGSTIDATSGVVALTSVTGASGAVQTANFWGGAFTVLQGRGRRAVTRLVLAGGDLTDCITQSGPLTRRFITAAAHGRPGRQLWGHDSHGNYTTQGRGAVATVRGTIWLTRDTCAGTLVVVRSGKVAVRDLGRRRTILVRAHHRYLARVR